MPVVFVFRLAGQDIIDNENFIITHGPYLQNIDQNGVTIVWCTNKPAIPGIYVISPDGTRKFIRNSHYGNVDGGGMLHKVRIGGLTPGTTYKYEINAVQVLKYQAYAVYYGDTLKLRAGSFSTFPRAADGVRFCVINDVHENSGRMASYLRNINIAEQDLFFFNGDMVDYIQDTEQLYRGFIDTAVSYFAGNKAFCYIRGNHETRGFMARELKEYFDFKDNRFYYSFDRGPVHFIVLDCGEDKPDNNRYYFGLADYDSYRLEELEWLKNEIKSEAFRNAKHRIVIVHMPVIKEERQGWGMKFLSTHFGPALQNAGIDLMISAHTHKNTFYDRIKSGFDYPVLVNSNNSFIEVDADLQNVKAIVRDVAGKTIATYNIK
jgi:predicted MPP superfamily phosphohydrolase